MLALQVIDLCKDYRVRTKEKVGPPILGNLLWPAKKNRSAVKGISFSIKPGEKVGFIGPNGAGKSTTIKMMTGVLAPSSGQVLLLGKDPQKARRYCAKRIGVLFGHRSQLWWELPATETFKLLRAIYGLSHEAYKEQLALLVKVLDAEELLQVPVRQLSLGQRMRLEIIATLIHRPELILLDEPTIGLDLIAKDRILECISLLSERFGSTVLLTSHDLSDIEKVCDRIVIIDRGELIFDGSVSNLRRQFPGKHCIKVEYAQSVEVLPFSSLAPCQIDQNRWKVLFNPEEVSAVAILEQLSRYSTVVDLSIQGPTIEDVVRLIYAHSANA